MPLSAIAGSLVGAAAAGPGSAVQPSSKVIDAHLAVQATIRSYQVNKQLS